MPLSKRIRVSSSQADYIRTSDQTLLTNIAAVYERACTSGKVRNLNFPSQVHCCPHTFFNDYQNREVTLIEYFKLIPEFNRLSIDDKVRLIRNHFGAMYYINEPILVQYKSDKLSLSLHNSFHEQLARTMLHSMDLMFAYANDPILLKLMLIVRSLSSSINRYRNDTDMDRIYDDTKSIFAGQNVYVELLWRYILYRSPSERDAVKFFNKLILDILSVQRTCLMADCYLYCLQDEIDQLQPLMRSMWPMARRASEVSELKEMNMNVWS